MNDIAKYARLVRWQNLIFLGILVWCMERWTVVAALRHIGFPELLNSVHLLLLGASVILIAAGGYVINDYFDVKIDRINRPDQLVITNGVSKETAMRLFQVLTTVGVLIGLFLAWQLHSWTIATLYVFTPGILWFYSASYKRMLLVGNLIVAFVAALVPLLVALANIAYLKLHFAAVLPYLPLTHDILWWLGGFALFAFLCTLIREIIKDLQDQDGDRELECHTLPICIGDLWSKIIVTLLELLLIALIGHILFRCLPFSTEWKSPSVRYALFGLAVPILCDIALLWSATIPSDYKSAQQIMKFVMFVGSLYSYVIFRLL